MASSAEIVRALHDTKYVKGYTHPFYRYPAATSPKLVRELLNSFTQPGDLVCDPFMGGGTVVVESLAAGRRVIASDVNQLAVFVGRAKTTPLTEAGWDAVEEWASNPRIFEGQTSSETSSAGAWLPGPLNAPLASARASAGSLDTSAERLIARCALLRIGQWALESRRHFPDADELHGKLQRHTAAMRAGMASLVYAARSAGIAKNQLRGSRWLRCRAAEELVSDTSAGSQRGSVKLLLTSPPYPGVHVLYHRWQVQGRRETAAPYWLIGAQDGHFMPYYTMGGRSAMGQRRYFERLSESFQALAPLLARDALVALVVGFADPTVQLLAFHGAMYQAGYEEVDPLGIPPDELMRDVPNRRWYVRVKHATSRELLLFYRRRSGR